MPIADDWNINYLTKQIYHGQWKDEITDSSSSVIQDVDITCSDVSGNITTGDYFTLYSATDAIAYYVWFNVAAGGGDPAPSGKTAIPVAVGATDTGTQVATAAATAINALAGFTSTGATTNLNITNATAGSTTNPATGTGLTGFVYTIATNGIGETIFSVNALYSYLQDTFDELGQMDDQVPMSAQTPTEYSLINQWFIDEVSIKYLNGGAIKTIGWTSVEIVQQDLPTTYTNVVSADIGKTVTETDTSDTGTLLFADNTRKRWWIRPDVPGAAGDAFDDPGSAYTIATGTGTGTSTSASDSGENTWANMYSIGTIESNTAIYVIQDSAKISAWWPVDHVDILVRVREAGSTTGSNGGDLGELMIGARQYSKLFDHFVSTGITGGRNPVPLATGADLNNTTGQYQTIFADSTGTWAVGETFTANTTSNKEGTVTSVSGSGTTQTIQYYLSGTSRTAFVNTDATTASGGATGTIVTPTNVVAGYSNIAFTFGDTNQDLNNGNGSVAYDVIIDCATRPVAELYEYLKFVTMRGYTNSPEQLKTGTGTVADTNIDGEQYIALLSSFTPVKASPFGTFAGGKFFGAQGVWITNYDTDDAQNFQLIDATGTSQVPPNTVAVTVSSIVASDVVGVFPLTAAAGTVEKDTYTVTTGALGGTTVLVSTAIDSRVPQTGVIRIVDDSDTAQLETQYEYYSWDTSTFSLNSSADRSLTLTATGSSGSNTVLVDTGATFQTWRVRAGDIITNTTDASSTANVVTVDSQTQITTDGLTGGTLNTFANNDSYTFETQLTTAAESGVDTLYVPLINEVALSTSVSNTLIYTTPVIPVLVRVRQGKVILPFEIETEVGASGMSQAAIRTTDTIAT